MIRTAFALITLMAAAPALAQAQDTFGATDAQIAFCDWRTDVMERAWDYREMNIKFWERTEVTEPSFLAIYRHSWTYSLAAPGEGDDAKQWHRENWMKQARFSCLTGSYGS